MIEELSKLAEVAQVAIVICGMLVFWITVHYVAKVLERLRPTTEEDLRRDLIKAVKQVCRDARSSIDEALLNGDGKECVTESVRTERMGLDLLESIGNGAVDVRFRQGKKTPHAT